MYLHQLVCSNAYIHVRITIENFCGKIEKGATSILTMNSYKNATI